ncbi:uncharacterized protein LOC142175333 [Nicotiana tabacum]|uniref:Uncharacterized protein LOC142175333 n=1 Tax=Nicotiana tabacum TaxID=4097 RepID=A0AC58TLC0_TOBAC
MWILQSKLKKLSNRLSNWSRQEIGDINDQVSKWEDKIQLVEDIDIDINSGNSRADANKAHAEYIKWLSMHESLLKQKTQTKWFQDGDSNTRKENIAKAAVKHFKSLFNLPKPTINPDILNCIPNCISDEDNIMLSAIPNEEKINEAIFIYSADSTAGPNGFNGTFFHHCWDIIKQDVIAFVRDFFNECLGPLSHRFSGDMVSQNLGLI